MEAATLNRCDNGNHQKMRSRESGRERNRIDGSQVIAAPLQYLIHPHGMAFNILHSDDTVGLEFACTKMYLCKMYFACTKIVLVLF